jgi:hypothetical protein
MLLNSFFFSQALLYELPHSLISWRSISFCIRFFAAFLIRQHQKVKYTREFSYHTMDGW